MDIFNDVKTCVISFFLINMDTTDKIQRLFGFMKVVTEAPSECTLVFTAKKLPESKLCSKMLSSELQSRERKVSANTYLL